MESSKTVRRARTLMVLGLGAAALWFGSQAMVATPRAHAQDDTAVDADASSPDVAPVNISGSWTGTADDDKHGSGTFTATFTQTDGSKVVVVSPWEVDFSEDTSAGGTGSGKVNGKAVKLVLFDTTISDKCRMDVSAKITVTDDAASEIVGNYTITKCFSKNSKGSIELSPITPTPTPTPS